MFPTLLFSLLLQTSPISAQAPQPLESEQAEIIQHEEKSKQLEIIEVRSQRRTLAKSTHSSLNTLTEADITIEAPKHPNEIFDRIPGAWISSGSGQEHLTAIRSPVLTGSGACGAFMVLEDQVPTRPSSFCNVNQLFEVNVAQAQSIDVLRGPGTVTYGSNALHGAINITTPGPAARSSSTYSLEAGSND